MPKNKIRVGLLNVQCGIGTTRGYYQYLLHMHKYYFRHGSKNIEKLGLIAKQEKIDIMATVEIDQGSKRTGQVDQVELLSGKGEFEQNIFFSTMKIRQRVNHGNAIHSRYPILCGESHILPGKGEPRSLGIARIRVAGKEFNFCATHLSLNTPFRKAQIDKLLSILNKTKLPMILAGDFNVKHKGELDLLEKSALQKVFSSKTYPAWKPSRWLDYVFASRSILISEGRVLPDLLSDHRLMVVDVYI